MDGFFDGTSAVVEHGADLAECVADDVAVVEVKSSVLDQDGGDCAAAAVELGFDDGADGLAARGRLGRPDVGDQADHLQQQVKVDALLGGDFDKDRSLRAAGPLFRDEAAVGELLLDTLGVGFRLVDLVDGDDNGHAGGLGMVDGFQGLGHHAVVGGDHHYNDVGYFGSAGSHACEGLVAGGIEEDDLTAECRRAFLGEANFVGANMLGYAASLARGDVGLADGVKQRRLAVIDVAHDGDNRGAGDFELAGILGFEDLFDGLVGDLFLVADDVGGGAELGGDILDHFGVEGLVDGDKDTFHQ